MNNLLNFLVVLLFLLACVLVLGAFLEDLNKGECIQRVEELRYLESAPRDKVVYWKIAELKGEIARHCE